nr:MAG TPA: hypothetical protein [Caudoviricetes sp.]
MSLSDGADNFMACFRRVAGIQWNQAVFVQAKRWRNMNALRCWPEENAAPQGNGGSITQS